MNDLLVTALSQYGISEIPGEINNPEVLKYFDEIGHAWVDEETTPWCAAFINWVAQQAGYEMTGKLNARSFLDIGDEIQTPQLGDLVIFWRKSKNSVYGHVAIFIREAEHVLYVLSGNQKNQVNISAYRKDRVLGYRRLRKVTSGGHQMF